MKIYEAFVSFYHKLVEPFKFKQVWYKVSIDKLMSKGYNRKEARTIYKLQELMGKKKVREHFTLRNKK